MKKLLLIISILSGFTGVGWAAAVNNEDPMWKLEWGGKLHTEGLDRLEKQASGKQVDNNEEYEERLSLFIETSSAPSSLDGVADKILLNLLHKNLMLASIFNAKLSDKDTLHSLVGYLRVASTIFSKIDEHIQSNTGIPENEGEKLHDKLSQLQNAIKPEFHTFFSSTIGYYQSLLGKSGLATLTDKARLQLAEAQAQLAEQKHKNEELLKEKQRLKIAKIEKEVSETLGATQCQALFGRSLQKVHERELENIQLQKENQKLRKQNDLPKQKENQDLLMQQQLDQKESQKTHEPTTSSSTSYKNKLPAAQPSTGPRIMTLSQPSQKTTTAHSHWPSSTTLSTGPKVTTPGQLVQKTTSTRPLITNDAQEIAQDNAKPTTSSASSTVITQNNPQNMSRDAQLQERKDKLAAQRAAQNLANPATSSASTVTDQDDPQRNKAEFLRDEFVAIRKNMNDECISVKDEERLGTDLKEAEELLKSQKQVNPELIYRMLACYRQLVSVINFNGTIGRFALAQFGRDIMNLRVTLTESKRNSVEKRIKELERLQEDLIKSKTTQSL
ncbi:MAG: hypothetical protein WCT20_00780 [Candidatus Babeliales bacterium]